GERVKALMFRLGMTEGVPIESKLISRRIENAQKSVEAQNFDARKHLLEYDDVMNKQRETIYAIRLPLIDGNLKDFAFVLKQHHRNGRRSRFSVRTLRIRANHRGRLRIRHGQTILQKMLTCHGLGISTKQNVRSTPGHVRCHSDRAFSTRLGDDPRL